MDAQFSPPQGRKKSNGCFYFIFMLNLGLSFKRKESLEEEENWVGHPNFFTT